MVAPGPYGMQPHFQLDWCLMVCCGCGVLLAFVVDGLLSDGLLLNALSRLVC